MNKGEENTGYSCAVLRLKENETAGSKEVNEAVKKAFEENPDLYKRLCRFALYKMKSFLYGRSGNNYPDDFVQTAIQKILEGKRKWNRGKIPEIADFIRLTILSVIRNEGKSKQRTVTQGIEDGVRFKPGTNGVQYGRGNFRAEYRRLSEKILSLFLNDEIAYFVLELRLADHKSNIAIAKNLGIEVRDVECALKRIRKKLMPMKNGKL